MTIEKNSSTFYEVFSTMDRLILMRKYFLLLWYYGILKAIVKAESCYVYCFFFVSFFDKSESDIFF